ncbi:GNAT family N-acetyltransferase [Bacillus marinisedimentorum]|uniref:GNAT family N-acetyltransferase n=1 Tax=Bacillus marinisedimentorum TaxID=1821260 RepID=UPI0007E220F0|nr:GNAT family N-acetyltransferase [Bacillus marinisedimentorum]
MEQLETSRLILRPLERGDAESIFAYASDPTVAKFTTWEVHHHLDDTREFIELAILEHKRKDTLTWGIILKETGDLIGTAGLADLSFRHHCAELGYVIGKPHWRTGYVTEASKAVCTFGFRELELNRIMARCHPENTGSERVMQKIGMTYEGTMRQVYFADGIFEDRKVYSILKEEFPFAPLL